MISWTDADGDECHITLGEEFRDYAGVFADAEYVGVIEIREGASDHWHPVWLTREAAEHLRDELSVRLG